MLEKLRAYGVVPVVAVDTVEAGMKLCETLIGAGLPIAEITFRTSAAEATIRAAANAFPELALGAGTVLTVEDLDRAISAGATFAVAPGCNRDVVQAAVERDFPFAPGVCTPSDVERALSLGVRELKFFPAEAAGGITMLKALIGPYGHLGLSFCPTGGIKTSNMLEYLSLDQVAVVGGTWIASKGAIRDGNWDAIARNARDAVALVRTIRP